MCDAYSVGKEFTAHQKHPAMGNPSLPVTLNMLLLTVRCSLRIEDCVPSMNPPGRLEEASNALLVIFVSQGQVNIKDYMAFMCHYMINQIAVAISHPRKVSLQYLG